MGDGVDLPGFVDRTEPGVSHWQVMPESWQLAHFTGAMCSLLAAFFINARAIWTIRAKPHKESRIGKGALFAIVALLLAAAIMLTITYQPMLNLAAKSIPPILNGLGGEADLGEAGYLSRVNLGFHAGVLGLFLFLGSLVYWLRCAVARRILARQKQRCRRR